MLDGWSPAAHSSSPPTFLKPKITSSWEAVGRIAAIAVIRTFLNDFLERDPGEIRERQGAPDPDH